MNYTPHNLELPPGDQKNYSSSSPENSHQPIQEPIQAIEFFAISTTRLVFLSFLTVGFYIVYWFYRNWVAIKKADQSNISPFWRAFFSIFFVHSLFKRIDRSIRSQPPYKRKFSPSFLTFLYVLFFLLQNLGRGVLNLILLIFVQRAINFNNQQINPNYKLHKSFTKGEKVLMIVGICLWLGVILYYGSGYAKLI